MSTIAAGSSFSRLSGLLVFLGLPAMLLTASVLSAFDIGDTGFAVQEKEFQLTSLMRLLTAPAKDGKPLDVSGIYITAETSTLASANLQKIIVQSVADASGKIIETSSLAPGEELTETATQQVGIRASFDIGNDGLLTLLHGLEIGLPLIFVDKISIRRMPGDTDTDQEDRLRVDMEVHARWKASLS